MSCNIAVVKRGATEMPEIKDTLHAAEINLQTLELRVRCPCDCLCCTLESTNITSYHMASPDTELTTLLCSVSR